MELKFWDSFCVICKLFLVLPHLVIQGQGNNTLYILYEGEGKWQWCHLGLKYLIVKKGDPQNTSSLNLDNEQHSEE